MSTGLGMLYCAVTSKIPLVTLEERGVERSFFIGNELKVYDYLRRHFIRFGSFPDFDTVAAETGVKIPTFPDEPLDYWVQRLEERHHSSLIMASSKKMQEVVSKGDIESARVLVRNLYSQVSIADKAGRVYQLQALAREVLEHHDRLQLSSGIGGIPFGIPYLDEVSGGAQASDSIVLVGSPSIGKSYMMAQFCLNSFASGGTPLLCTFEMSAFQFARRILALRNHVMATMIRLGRLSHWAREKLRSDVSFLEHGRLPFPIFEGSLKTTIDDVVLRVQELRPSALYVDGAYLLKMSGKPMSLVDRVRETAEMLKMIAKEFKIPVFSSYQFNKKGEGLRNIYSGDAVSQYGSIVIGIRDEEDYEEGPSEGRHRFDSAQEFKVLDLLKGREGERGKIRILYDMQTMRIEQDSVLEGYSFPDGGERGN